MANFARINSDGIVIDKHTIVNEVMLDKNGIEQEKLGQEFLSKLWGGNPSDYIQTSYNSSIRGKFAKIGDLYDKENNIFVAQLVMNTPTE